MRGVQKKKDKVQPPFQFILFTRSDLQLSCWYTIKQLEEVNKIKGRVSVCCLNCKRRKKLTEFHCFIVLAVAVHDSYLYCQGFASPCCLRHATWHSVCKTYIYIFILSCDRAYWPRRTLLEMRGLSLCHSISYRVFFIGPLGERCRSSRLSCNATRSILIYLTRSRSD